MTSKPLEILKRRLKILQAQAGAKKEKLRLLGKKSIPLEDEKPPDNEAKFVDERQDLDALENASNYERGFDRLDDVKKGDVRRLQELAGETGEEVGRKRKRSETKTKESGETSKRSSRLSPVFIKKENATLAQRIEILDWYHKNGKNQSKTAKHFDSIYPNLKLKQPLVSAWVKDEEKWRDDWANSSDSGHTAKRARQTQHPEVTEMMELWVLKAMTNNLLLTGEILREKWTKFADLAGVPQDDRLGLSEGWLTRFKTRNGLKQSKRHGDVAWADPDRVKTEQKRMQELIDKYGYELQKIFDMDETGMS